MPFQNVPHWKAKHLDPWRAAVTLGPTACPHANLNRNSDPTSQDVTELFFVQVYLAIQVKTP